MTDTEKTKAPRVPRTGTARRRVLDELQRRRGLDVGVAALFMAAFPGRDLPLTNRQMQQFLGSVLQGLRRAGWAVRPGEARRTYRID